LIRQLLKAVHKRMNILRSKRCIFGKEDISTECGNRRERGGQKWVEMLKNVSKGGPNMREKGQCQYQPKGGTKREWSKERFRGKKGKFGAGKTRWAKEKKGKDKEGFWGLVKAKGVSAGRR